MTKKDRKDFIKFCNATGLKGLIAKEAYYRAKEIDRNGKH